MKRPLILALLFLAACYGTQQSACGSGPTPVPPVIVAVVASPTPPPFPTPASTPDPCRVESLVISFSSGVQLPWIGAGQAERLDLTPFNSGGQVTDSCNLARTPSWAVGTPTICLLEGGGYNPFIKGLRPGACNIQASVSSQDRLVVASFTVEVR